MSQAKQEQISYFYFVKWTQYQTTLLVLIAAFREISFGCVWQLVQRFTTGQHKDNGCVCVCVKFPAINRFYVTTFLLLLPPFSPHSGSENFAEEEVESCQSQSSERMARTQDLLDMTGLLLSWIHSSHGFRHKTYTRSSQLKCQHLRAGTQKPYPPAGALLQFSSGILPHIPVDASHSYTHTDSMNQTQFNSFLQTRHENVRESWRGLGRVEAEVIGVNMIKMHCIHI